MKKAAVHSIFWILLFISVAFLTAYLLITINNTNAVLLSRDLNVKIEKYKMPIFDIKGVLYSELGAVANIEFELTNIGDNIELNGWVLEFANPYNNMVICRATIYTGDPTEDARVYKEVKIAAKNISLSYGDILPQGDVASVSIQLLETCLNETIGYARTGEKMKFKLIIPPTSAETILKCNVDPYTGFATCN